jgi:hypothetical protein
MLPLVSRDGGLSGHLCRYLKTSLTQMILGRFMPPYMLAGVQPSGVTVVIRGQPADSFNENPSATALLRAITFGTGGFAYGSTSPNVPDGVLRVIIAAKPDPLFPKSTAPTPAADTK